jgi:hypothetical protein
MSSSSDVVQVFPPVGGAFIRGTEDVPQSVRPDEAAAPSFDPAIVRQYAPVVYFHPAESAFPCSIEVLLQNSVLMDRNQPEWQLPNPTQASLQQYATPNYYLAVSASGFAGTGVTAPMYYAVQQYDDAVQISYVMLYGFQGGQTCRDLLCQDFDCIVKTLGMHQGDLERVVVTLVPNGQGGYDVLRVGYEAHGDVTYYPTQRVTWEDGTHPVVCSALNGHSSYNLLAQGAVINDFVQPGVVAITSLLSQGGQVWRPYTSGGLKLLGLDANGAPIGDQLWAAFQGRLGDRQTNELDSATYLDGSNLSWADWASVKLIGWGAELLGKFSHSVLNGDGPTGPADRDWVRPVSGTLPGVGLATP